MNNIIGLKQLRSDFASVIAKVKRGGVLTVVNRSLPVFKIVPVLDPEWEEVADFTTVQKGGVSFGKVIKALQGGRGQTRKTSRKANR